MDLGLIGRRAVVGGSSKGIGRAVAHMLAAEGAAVVVNGRDSGRAETTANEIAQATGRSVVAIPSDLSTADGATTLIDGAVDALGGIDILVTNAGGPRSGTFRELDDADFQATFELNFMSAVRVIRGALPHLKASDAGRIINIASTAVKEPVPNVTLTNSIRPAVVGLAKDLANDLGPDGITVNTILSGPVMTDRLRYTTEERAATAGISVEDQWRRYLALVPLGRFGEPEDVAALAVFLASDQASWITGTVIQADGGRIRSAT